MPVQRVVQEVTTPPAGMTAKERSETRAGLDLAAPGPNFGLISRGAISLSEAYRIPKREVTAEVSVIGKKPATLKIFLSQQAKSHTGYERPSDLLNGIDTFFPALDEHGDLVLLQRDAVK